MVVPQIAAVHAVMGDKMLERGKIWFARQIDVQRGNVVADEGV